MYASVDIYSMYKTEPWYKLWGGHILTQSTPLQALKWKGRGGGMGVYSGVGLYSEYCGMHITFHMAWNEQRFCLAPDLVLVGFRMHITLCYLTHSLMNVDGYSSMAILFYCV